MFRSMLWKEYRDGRTVWTALGLLGISTILVVPLMSELLELQHTTDATRIFFLLQIWLIVYGIVSGSMLFAGERESRTLSFLDLLQPRRGALWGLKALAGGLFALGMGSLFTALYLGSVWWNNDRSEWFVLVLILVAFDALPWGMAASGLCRTVLPAVGLATLGYLLSVFVSSLFLQAPLLFALSRVFFMLLTLGVSAVMFCQPEPNGPPQEGGISLFREILLPRIPTQGGFFRVQAWICWQQGRLLFLGLLSAAVLVGFVAAPLAAQTWPLASLLVGVLCGLMVWSDEQAGGHWKFLGDQRLPLFRLWLFKTLFWFGAGLLILFVAAVSGIVSFVVASWHLPGRSVEDGFIVIRMARDILNPLLLLSMWLLYGFTLAQLTVMIWRKTVVTFVLTFMAALSLTGIWIPSLVLGGLPTWQVLVPPLLWLVTGALLLWSWASIGLTGWRPVLLLLLCSSTTGLWIAGCLIWRVEEVPVVAEPFDAVEFQASYPTVEKNEAGRLIQAAVGLGQTGGTLPPGELVVPPPPRTFRIEIASEDLLTRVLEQGWSKAPPTLGVTLDDYFREPWIVPLEQAVRRPLGIIDDPTLGRTNPQLLLPRLRIIGILFSVRALQAQAIGQPHDAVKHLETVLCLARQLRNKSPAQSLLYALNVERWGLEATELLLPGLLRDHPEAARSLLHVLTVHAQEMPSVEDNLRAEYLLIVQRINGQSPPLPVNLTGDQRVHWYNQLLITSLQTPWERERADRLYQLSYVRARATLTGKTASVMDDHLLRNSWLRFLDWQNWEQLRALHESNLCHLHGFRILLALGLYERQEGKPAPTLEALVPAYLPRVPLDPFTGAPFNYRIGVMEETLRVITPEIPGGEVQPVQAGQGIAWSTGPDRINESGATQTRIRAAYRRGKPPPGDWIFVVPVPTRGN